MPPPTPPRGVEILRRPSRAQSDILSPAALDFVARLHRRFEARRQELLQARVQVQHRLDDGWRPDFALETRRIRESDWRIAPAPADLVDRRVEITGPADRKMIINALNSGANVFMADFEDSLSPTWDNVVDGQIHLRDAARGTIEYDDPQTHKHYALGDKPATLVVRPRGWHLPERHVLVDETPVAGALFDFGLFFFHNAAALLQRGTGPYFYLPKLENHLEARLWNEVFDAAQDELGIPRGTIRATVLVETILAAFEMEEILWELRTHAAGLNCGRWDYIFSYIKKFRNDPECLLPDRDQVGMTRHFLRSYSRLLIQTCHRRGAHAMGGMAAQIPIRDDRQANEAALAKVRADKDREARDGHDGTWVAHPGLVGIARGVFEGLLPGENQLHRKLDEFRIGAPDLLQAPEGTITEAGLRHNVNVGLSYLDAWLRGSGCVPLYDLMEDAATAEICRSQLWQWTRHGARLADGRRIDAPMMSRTIQNELEFMRRRRSDAVGDRLDQAADLFEDLVLQDHFAEFLTIPAYEHLIATNVSKE
ncbi:MAG TPA: malate synthase A [Candidatus Krumholzibacteria bacterium]|nr:malate synthase A [Candidatus Krumholzibacteria bacterium]